MLYQKAAQGHQEIYKILPIIQQIYQKNASQTLKTNNRNTIEQLNKIGIVYPSITSVLDRYINYFMQQTYFPPPNQDIS